MYLRCPHAFFQIDSGLVAREAMIDELGEQLIADGIAFEQSVASTAVPLPPDVGVREALAGDAPLSSRRAAPREVDRLQTVPMARLGWFDGRRGRV